MDLTFEWDSEKASTNLRNHGVSFGEATSVFGDPLGRIRADPRHSVAEERLVLLGLSFRGRLLAVMFTERAEDRIRLISARPATRHEHNIYEESTL